MGPVQTFTAFMNNAEYHEHPAISKSHLDAINISPLHYWSRYVDPNRSAPTPTLAMEFGTAVHMAVLEPDLYLKTYKRAPELSRTTKAGKEAWAEAGADGHTLIKSDEWAQIEAMRQQIFAHPAAGKALNLPGQAEQTFLVNDPFTGLPTKCRPDYFTDSGWLIDLKTTQDASLKGFQRSIANFRYHVQAAYYTSVIKAAQGVAPRGFLFIAVEKTYPYAVQVFKCSQSLLDAGEIEATRNLRQLTDAFDEYTLETPWPGYSLNPVEIDLPTWAANAVPPSTQTY
jgi:hypothetical protein